MSNLLMILCLVLSTTLSAETHVLAFAGSTRQDSTNKKLISEAAKVAQQLGAKVTLIDLKDYSLPFYEGDLEAKEGMPLKARQIRQLMIENQVIFIASPEYNGSLCALLKNVIDWASRGEAGGSSRDAFKDKKFVLFSASPGQGGGARGLKHLLVLENVGGTVLPQEVVIPNAYSAFDEKGQLTHEKEKEELKQAIQAAFNL